MTTEPTESPVSAARKQRPKSAYVLALLAIASGLASLCGFGLLLLLSPFFPMLAKIVDPGSGGGAQMLAAIVFVPLLFVAVVMGVGGLALSWGLFAQVRRLW